MKILGIEENEQVLRCTTINVTSPFDSIENYRESNNDNKPINEAPDGSWCSLYGGTCMGDLCSASKVVHYKECLHYVANNK